MAKYKVIYNNDEFAEVELKKSKVDKYKQVLQKGLPSAYIVPIEEPKKAKKKEEKIITAEEAE